MKNILAAACAIFVNVGAVNAQSWNIDGFVGKNLSNGLMWDGVNYSTNSDKTFGLSISKSGVFTPRLELGFEISRATSEYTCCTPNSISGTSAMLTAKYNVIENNNFQAYGGVGLGVVKVKYINAGSYSNSDTVAGGQLTLGGRYKISPTMKVYMEARYLVANDAKVAYSPASSDAEFKSKSIVIGLRKSF